MPFVVVCNDKADLTYYGHFLVASNRALRANTTTEAQEWKLTFPVLDLNGPDAKHLLSKYSIV